MRKTVLVVVLAQTIEPENWPTNSPGLNPVTVDYSIFEDLSQRVYKLQRIRDMQHMKDLLEEN